MVGLQYVVLGLTDQVTACESQSSDLKFTVTTNLKAQGVRLDFSMAEINKIEEHIWDLEKKNTQMVELRGDGECRNLEARHHVS